MKFTQTEIDVIRMALQWAQDSFLGPDADVSLSASVADLLAKLSPSSEAEADDENVQISSLNQDRDRLQREMVEVYRSGERYGQIGAYSHALSVLAAVKDGDTTMTEAYDIMYEGWDHGWKKSS